MTTFGDLGTVSAGNSLVLRSTEVHPMVQSFVWVHCTKWAHCGLWNAYGVLRIWTALPNPLNWVECGEKSCTNFYLRFYQTLLTEWSVERSLVLISTCGLALRNSGEESCTTFRSKYNYTLESLAQACLSEKQISKFGRVFWWMFPDSLVLSRNMVRSWNVLSWE